MAPVLLVLIATLANGLVHRPAHKRSIHDGFKMVTNPMFINPKDCWTKVRIPKSIAMTQLAQKVYKLNTSNPGAGIGDVAAQERFGTVMKDGYYEVACVKDYMYHHGDAAGANKHEYEIGTRANVSIVHYKDLVPKEDQEAMSSEVCFNFCRTVPDMLFFGLTAGRECYCEPYFQQMAGDSSKCDAVCEGNPTTMCGGMAKSTVFQMHFCDSTAGDLADAADKAAEFYDQVEELLSLGRDESDAMQEACAAGQETFGNAGDPVMSDLMQSGKVFAGDFQHSMEDATKVAEMLKTEVDTAKGMDGADFTNPDEMKKAEDTMKKIGELTTELKAKAEESRKLHELLRPAEHPGEENLKEGKAELKEVEGEPLKQYHPTMYFVDREFENVPSTCGGDVLKKPVLASGDAQACAAACNAEGIACAGFSHVATGKHSVCFMFSKMKSITYFTECGGEGPPKGEFLQKPNQTAPVHVAMQKGSEKTEHRYDHDDPSQTMCYAKFASFTGTTLKPDPSGKCDLCLKTADKAQRCFE